MAIHHTHLVPSISSRRRRRHASSLFLQPAQSSQSWEAQQLHCLLGLQVRRLASSLTSDPPLPLASSPLRALKSWQVCRADSRAPRPALQLFFSFRLADRASLPSTIPLTVARGPLYSRLGLATASSLIDVVAANAGVVARAQRHNPTCQHPGPRTSKQPQWASSIQSTSRSRPALSGAGSASTAAAM